MTAFWGFPTLRTTKPPIQTTRKKTNTWDLKRGPQRLSWVTLLFHRKQQTGLASDPPRLTCGFKGKEWKPPTKPTKTCKPKEPDGWETRTTTGSKQRAAQVSRKIGGLSQWIEGVCCPSSWETTHNEHLQRASASLRWLQVFNGVFLDCFLLPG